MSALARHLIHNHAEALACDADQCPLLAEHYRGVCLHLAALILGGVW